MITAAEFDRRALEIAGEKAYVHVQIDIAHHNGCLPTVRFAVYEEHVGWIGLNEDTTPERVLNELRSKLDEHRAERVVLVGVDPLPEAANG